MVGLIKKILKEYDFDEEDFYTKDILNENSILSATKHIQIPLNFKGYILASLFILAYFSFPCYLQP